MLIAPIFETGVKPTQRLLGRIVNIGIGGQLEYRSYAIYEYTHVTRI